VKRINVKEKIAPCWRELVARTYDIKSLGNVGNILDGLLKFQ
ncbi:hypothetical protein HMPREF9075_01314, partial [Capnocytophaga sp. oral taxon 332 str. F0381]